MLQNIYCVKLRQRKLVGKNTKLDYFPFDRFYIMKQKDEKLARSMFRYSFSMEITEPLQHAINGIQVEQYRRIPIKRNDKVFGYTNNNFHTNFFESRDISVGDGSWMLLVPTHIRTRKEEQKNKEEKLVSYVGYVLSRIIRLSYHNKKELLPAVKLNTPKRTLPLLCVYCLKITDFYAGNCNPGQKTCNETADIIVDQDDYYKEGDN